MADREMISQDKIDQQFETLLDAVLVHEVLDPRVAEDLETIEILHRESNSRYSWDHMRPRVIAQLNRRYGVTTDAAS